MPGQNDLLQPIAKRQDKKRAQERLNKPRHLHSQKRVPRNSEGSAQIEEKSKGRYLISDLFLKERELGRDTSSFIYPFLGRQNRKRLSLVIKVHIPRRHGGIY